MEGVLSPVALFNELSFCTPSEAVLKVFNVLFPYTKPMPVYKETQVIMDEFFGSSFLKTRNEIPIYVPDETQIGKLNQELETMKKKFLELKDSYKENEKKIEKLEEENKNKSAENENLKKNLAEYQEKIKKNVESQEKIKKNAETQEKFKKNAEIIEIKENSDFFAQISELKKQLEKSSEKIKSLSDYSNRLEKELKARPLLQDLENALEKQEQTQADNRNLRFKAGKIFLKGLESPEVLNQAPPEIYIQDLEVLKRLEASLSKNPPDIAQRFRDANANQDGMISKSEACDVFTKLNLPPQDTIVLLRILGFRQGKNDVLLEEILNVMESVESKENELKNNLFIKILESFFDKNLTVDMAFDYLDVNHDGVVNFAEFSEGIDNLKINLNREDKHGVFAVFDTNHNGTISLDELKSKLIGVKVDKNKEKIEKPKKNETVEKFEKNKENERKLIGRKALKANGRYYLVSLYNEENESVKIGLSLADDSNSPMYEQISHKMVAKMKPDQLFSLIEISPSHQITLKTEKNQKNENNEKNKMIENIEKNKENERKLIGRKALKANGRYYLVSLYNEENESIKIGLSLADDSNSPMYEQISHKIVGKMKPDQLFSLIEISPSHQIALKTEKNKKNESNQKNKIDKNKESERKLIGRKALKANGRYYLVSLYNEEKESIKISLSLADDSNSPMYDQISHKIIPKMNPNHIFSLIEISQSHQITLKDLEDSIGSLSIKIESFKGLISSLLHFNILNTDSIKPLQLNQEFKLDSLILKPNKPIPLLNCKVLKTDTKAVISSASLSIEVAISEKD